MEIHQHREVSDESDQEADHDVVACSRSGARDDGASSGRRRRPRTTPVSPARRATTRAARRRRRPWASARCLTAERRRHPSRPANVVYDTSLFHIEGLLSSRATRPLVGLGDRTNIWLVRRGRLVPPPQGGLQRPVGRRCGRDRIHVQPRWFEYHHGLLEPGINARAFLTPNFAIFFRPAVRGSAGNATARVLPSAASPCCSAASRTSCGRHPPPVGFRPTSHNPHWARAVRSRAFFLSAGNPGSADASLWATGCS
jgi:hypothetical protein